MKKFGLLAVATLSCLLLWAQFAQAAVARSTAIVRAPIQTAGAFNRQTLLQSLNKSLSLEGFYYDGSTPMLLESMEFLKPDTPIPPDKYVPLSGPLPKAFQSGAKVRIAGTAVAPTGTLAGEKVAIQVDPSSAVLQPAPVMSSQTLIAAIQGMTPVQTSVRRYALLIGTGCNPANDFPRYWNDMWQMYHILLAKGYAPGDIRVAYRWGTPRTSGMPVNYPASLAGISAAFGYFVPRVTAADSMYIMVVGQGSAAGDPYATPVYWTWQNTPMYPGVFAGQVNRIANYNRMVIHMSQAYSGAFTPLLARPKRVIVTSSSPVRTAYSHPSYWYGNFNYWYMSGIVKHQLLGGAPLSSDSNGNGKISVTEAYNCTLGKPGLVNINVQMPWYDDNGAMPARFGPVPGAGEGALGSATNF